MIYATANGAHATLTKCARMQKDEENPKKDVPNGNGDCERGDREEPPRSAYAHGGRLKFFKDGKFILELERSREGERVSWVSVPRKTFWPPQGTASSTPTYRQESSTSLSVSDDNSSIQSSPWQRDHSWKQTSPRKNLSKQLTFYYLASGKLRKSLQKSRKTRKPYDSTAEEFIKHVRGLPLATTSSPTPTSPSNTSPKPSTSKKKEKRLQTIIQALAEKVPAGSPARETVVSPRKRFLREMDKDAKTHVDDSCLKRSRGKTAAASKAVGSPVRTNGVASTTGIVDHVGSDPHPPPASTPSRQTQTRNSSYSITSLLAEDKSIRRSPANSPSHYSPGAAAAGHPYSTPMPEDRWYAESVDRLRSIELSHVDKRLCLPYATPPSFMPPFIHPYTMPPHYFHAFARGFPGLTAAPPACLLPPPVRPEAPSCSWAAEPPRDNRTQDDNIADMPLNLSKHAG